VDARAGQRFRAGEDAGEGVLSPGFSLADVGGAAPEIDDVVAVHPDGDGRADLAAIAEVGFEGVANAAEARVADAVDGGSRVSVHEPPDEW
jgi:hypothetical protein